MRKIKGWHCDFCTKIMAYGSKRNMEIHEKHCLRNPANRTCVTCANFTRNYVNIADGGNYQTEPSCREGLIKPDPTSKFNSFGLRKDCANWQAKHPGAAE